MNPIICVSFVLLTISVNDRCVTGQYHQSDADEGQQSVADKRIDTATNSEYEYYDDEGENASTTLGTTIAIPSTTQTTTTSTTTTTTTAKPTAYRFVSNRRNGLRTSSLSSNNNNKKKFGINQVPTPYDTYTEASNENAFVQQPKSRQPLTPTPAQLRNAVIDLDRGANVKESQDRLASDEHNGGNGNNNYFSRRYARFLFRQRSG